MLIEEMFAFVAQDEDGEGGEGIMACEMILQGERVMMPLVGADKKRIVSLVPFAENIKTQTGKDYKIIRFHSKEDVTTEIKNGCNK